MKFPTNQLLYVAILGLLGGSGWQFWVTWKERRAQSPTQRRELVRSVVTKSMARAEERKPEAKGPPYDQRQFWESFKLANLTGKVPPPPKDPREKVEKEEEQPVDKTPIADICTIVCLVFEEGESRAVVRYTPTSNIEPPAELVKARETASAMPAPRNVPKNRPRKGKAKARPAPMPRNPSLEGGWTHILDLEDRLWPPFAHIRLVRVDDNAEFAEFVRSEEGGKEGEPEKLFRDELGLSQEISEVLYEAKLADRRKPAEQKLAPLAQGPFQWIEGEKTRRIKGDYHIGRVDWDAWNKDSNRIFSREIGTRTYSRRGVSGVQITKASERFKQFGVVDGDVIIAINGQPVKSKGEAIKIGKQLYKRGVRRFEATFLSRGRQVTRTVVAPEKGRGR